MSIIISLIATWLILMLCPWLIYVGIALLIFGVAYNIYDVCTTIRDRRTPPEPDYETRVVLDFREGHVNSLMDLELLKNLDEKKQQEIIDNYERKIKKRK